jgi:hypothetical protein
VARHACQSRIRLIGVSSHLASRMLAKGINERRNLNE